MKVRPWLLMTLIVVVIGFSIFLLSMEHPLSEKFRYDQAQRDMDIIVEHIGSYSRQHDRLPDSLEALQEGSEEDIPLVDPWGNDYYLEADSHRRGEPVVELRSLGPDEVKSYDDPSRDVMVPNPDDRP